MKKLFLTLTLVFFFPFGMSQELPLYLPTDGLIAYYLFNGNANDESGNGNHGTINGATLTTDRYNNADSAYAFDGFDDFIEAQIDQSSSFTVATWVKLNRNDQYFGFVQHKENCTRGGGYILGIDPNGNYRYTSSNCGECQPNPCANSYEIGYINSESGLLSSNLWYHLIVTNDGSGNYIFYLNGEVIGSESNDNMIFDYGIKPFSIGKYHDGSNLFYLDGSIDDIGLWSRALTEQEIQDVYTSSNGDILLNGVVSAENNQIKNVADPTDDKDAVTKEYLLEKISSLQDQIDYIMNRDNQRDDDGDGYTEVEGDCNDTEASIRPLVYEVADGIDNNCDGIIDEGYNYTPVIDIDGNSYNYVAYGDQVWTINNAEMTTYRDGTPILQVTDATEWANLTTGAWCYYNNDPSKGKLYNWYAVAGIHDNDENTPNKKLAPEGWHVPSDLDAIELEDYLINNGITTAGEISKSLASTENIWRSSTSNGTNIQAGSPAYYPPTNNSSGFNILFSGYRYDASGEFSEDSNNAPVFWSRTEVSATAANYIFYIRALYDYTTSSGTDKNYGFSVRFVKD
jgi:uncharacterized protein (TIGR02145 family)